MSNDAKVKYYDTRDRGLQFRDKRRDKEQTRPLTRHQTERRNEESTDEERLGGFNLKYASLWGERKSNVNRSKKLNDESAQCRKNIKKAERPTTQQWTACVNGQVFTEETKHDIAVAPIHENAVLATLSNDLNVNIGKMLESTDIPDRIEIIESADVEIKNTMKNQRQKHDQLTISDKKDRAVMMEITPCQAR